MAACPGCGREAGGEERCASCGTTVRAPQRPGPLRRDPTWRTVRGVALMLLALPAVGLAVANGGIDANRLLAVVGGVLFLAGIIDLSWERGWL